MGSDQAVLVGASTEKRQKDSAVWAVCSELAGDGGVRFAAEVPLVVFPNCPIEIAPLDPARRGSVEWPAFYGILAEPEGAEARKWVRGEARLAVAALPYWRGWVEVTRFRSRFKGRSAQWDARLDDVRPELSRVRVWFQDEVGYNPFERRKVRTAILINPRPTNRFLFSGRAAVGGDRAPRSAPKLCWGICRDYPEQRRRLRQDRILGEVLGWARDTGSDQGSFFGRLYERFPELARRCDDLQLHPDLSGPPQPGRPDLLALLRDECIDLALAGPEERFETYEAKTDGDLSVARYLLKVFADCLFTANRRLWDGESPRVSAVSPSTDRFEDAVRLLVQQLDALAEDPFAEAVESIIHDLEFGDLQATQQIRGVELAADETLGAVGAEGKGPQISEELLDLFCRAAAVLRSRHLAASGRRDLTGLLREFRDRDDSPIVRELARRALALAA